MNKYLRLSELMKNADPIKVNRGPVMKMKFTVEEEFKGLRILPVFAEPDKVQFALRWMMGNIEKNQRSSND